jgi:hypothetical protein
MELGPGEGADLTGVLRTGSEPGAVRRNVSVLAEDVERLMIPVKAEVKRRLNWSPNPLVLRPDVQQHLPGSARIAIVNGCDAEVRILDARAEDGQFALQFSPSSIPPGGSTNLTVTCPWHVLRNAVARATVFTSHPVETRLEVPISIEPKYPLECQPRAVCFGVLEKAALLARKNIRVVLAGSTLRQLRFSGVRSVPYLEVIGRRETSPESLEFSFKVIDRFKGIDLAGSLRFAFLVRDEEVSLEVPVTGFLAQIN